MDEVVVTGYRKSLMEARDLKKDAIILKDVIVAEDIAKFPELNLAESLQRLPGVQITREAGEGREIALRGLGPDFTRVQLNGMEVLGNDDSAMDSRGQRSRDRAFDFNIFASELFSKVEVEKTFQASQNEGGMAGTVGLFHRQAVRLRAGLQGRGGGQVGDQPIYQGRAAAGRRLVQPELGQQVRPAVLGRLYQARNDGTGPRQLQLRCP